MLSNFFDISEDLVNTLSRVNNEPDWLIQRRINGFNSYLNSPAEKSPLYAKYSTLNKTDFQDLILNGYNLPVSDNKIPEDFKYILDDNNENFTIFQIDGKLVDTFDHYSKENLILTNINDAIKKHPQLLKEYLTKNLLSADEDKFVALNNCMFNSGIFLYIPKHLRITKPIRIFNLFNEPINVVSKNLIILEEDSNINFIEEFYSTNIKQNNKSLFSNLTEIYLHQGATLNFTSIQSLSNNFINLVNRRSVGKQNSKINWSIGHLGSSFTRSRVDSVLKGYNATTEDIELVFGENKQNFDIVSDLSHQSSDTKGTALTKGVFRDDSSSIFKGMIKIDEGAKNSESYLAEHSLLLGKGARANAVPGLEIKTNDVKATHSASVALIDEAEIFYLMSRGLSKDEAHKMTIYAFMEPIIRLIPSSSVRSKIWYLLETKWLKSEISSLNPNNIINPEEENELHRISGPQAFFDKHYKYSGD